MRQVKICPECGFEGLMTCVNTGLPSGEFCICPKCEYRLGRNDMNTVKLTL